MFQTRKNKKSVTKKIIKKRKRDGGKLIASGGFGCIFKPALLCKNAKTDERDKNKVTKLLTTKHAIAEFNEIKEIRPFLQKIPNYSKYFMVDGFSICEPAPLTNKDMTNFKNCTALKKSDITKKNINDSLDKLLALNIPDGGIELGDFILSYSSSKIMIQLNNSLIELFQKGILPMNKLNIYHCDIKDSNILIGKNNVEPKIIDWGIACSYDIKKYNNNKDLIENIPSTWRNRPFQFNTPLSIILFNKTFLEDYDEFIKDVSSKSLEIDENNIHSFVVDFIYHWMKERGIGHFKTINSIMHILFVSDLENVKDDILDVVIETEFTMRYISNYISKILLHYQKKDSIDLCSYLNEVFINIVDVWGFVMCYLPFLEKLYDDYLNLTCIEKEIFNKLKCIFLTYLFEPRIKPIDIAELVKDLKRLNLLFLRMNKTTVKTSNKKITTKKSTSKKSSRDSKTKTNTESKKSNLYLSLI